MNKKDIEIIKNQISLVQNFLRDLSDGIVKDTIKNALIQIENNEKLSKNPLNNNVDPILVQIQKNSDIICLKKKKDILCLMIHLLMIENGFQCNGLEDETKEKGNNKVVDDIPLLWNQRSDLGQFNFMYKHPKKENCLITLKAIFIHHKLEVFISESNNEEKIYTMSIRWNDYINEEVNIDKEKENKTQDFSKLIKDMRKLRVLFNISVIQKLFPTNESNNETNFFLMNEEKADLQQKSTAFKNNNLPSIGKEDIFPSIDDQQHGYTRRTYPGNEVGPDHPIFYSDQNRNEDESHTNPYKPTYGGIPGGTSPSVQGPTTGARFDPFGPVGPVGPGYIRGENRQGRPFGSQGGPRMPFSEPDPDHLRMPNFNDGSNFGFNRF